MKKILILGGSHRDIPLINAAKELGYYVITLGDREYYLGHDYSNKAYKISFNDLEKVKEIIEEEKVDFLLPGCGEESYLNTVRLSKELKIGKFDDLEIATLIHNKWKFKEFCLLHNISTPKGFYYNSEKDLASVKFPIVVKPTNLSGGRGVDVVYNQSELTDSLTKAKKVSNEIFLEEFIDGKLIAYSIFLQNHKIVYGFVGEDQSYLNKYLITTAFAYEIEIEVLDKLKHDIEKIARLLKLVDGMFHLQVLIKENVPYIIDVTRRIPGDLYPYLIEYSDNVEYSKAVVKSYTTGAKEYTLKKSTSNFIIRHCVMPSKNGIYKGLYIDATIKDTVVHRLDLIKEETLVENYLNTQIAIIFIKLKSRDNKILENLNSLIYPILE